MNNILDLKLTASAIKHIQRQLCQRGSGLGLIIGTKTTGCSGLAYTLEYADALDSSLNMIQVEGLTVLADDKTSLILRGATLDYVKDGLKGGLSFTNPNEKDRCGCGESFRVNT